MQKRRKQPARQKDDTRSKFRVNDEIRCGGNVRIVGNDIESKVVTIQEARRLAERLGLDLVEINSGGDVPVIRVCNFEKYVYELKKSAKKAKQPSRPVKEVQLSVSIAKHDLETKAGHARKFLEEGSKVRVVLRMKGRELARRDENKKSILDFIMLLDDIAVPEAQPRDEGNRTIVFLKKKNNVKQSTTEK